MDIKLFTLTNGDNVDEIYAIGMSIVGDGGSEAAVTYRRGAADEGSTVALFTSPEAARQRFSAAIAPMEIVWDADFSTCARTCCGRSGNAAAKPTPLTNTATD